jgi:eukaryotic-like serine/threonine-protein kinase
VAALAGGIVAGGLSIAIRKLCDPTPVEPQTAPVAAPDAGHPEDAVVLIRSTPSGASVSVNGHPKGLTPQLVRAQPGSELLVEVQYPGFRRLTRRIRVDATPRQDAALSLVPVPVSGTPLGKVHFEIAPWGQVSCNGLDLGDTPFADPELPPAVYECRFTHPELGSRSRQVVVRADAVERVVIHF